MEIEDSKALRVAYASHVQLAGEILTDETVGDDIKLGTIKTIKKIFAESSEKTLGNIKLESLVDEANWQLAERKTSLNKDFLYVYGTTVVDFIGRNAHLDSKLFDQLKLVLFELKERDVLLTDKLVEHLWHRFVNNWILHIGFMKSVMSLLGKVVERFALNWVDGTMSAPEFDYHLKVSSECPEFFQAASSVLYEILLKSEGSVLVLEKITTFVKLVISRCENERKDAFKLYPPDCRRLVSLLIIYPEVYPKTEGYKHSVTTKSVLELLSKVYLKNRREALMLLSHFPRWLENFKLYLDEGCAAENQSFDLYA